MTNSNFFFKFKKPSFWHFLVYFPIFGAGKVFPKNWLPKKLFFQKTTLQGFPAHTKIQRNLMTQFQENTHTGGKDG